MNYSDRADTWTKKSDLRSSSWNPYPGLMPSENCHHSNKYPGVENYYSTAQNVYSGRKNIGPHLHQTNYFYEGYTKNRPFQTYDSLDQTWNEQKPYTL